VIANRPESQTRKTKTTTPDRENLPINRWYAELSPATNHGMNIRGIDDLKYLEVEIRRPTAISAEKIKNQKQSGFLCLVQSTSGS